MPPVSSKQHRYIRAAAARGEKWAIKYLRNWKRESSHRTRSRQLKALKK